MIHEAETEREGYCVFCGIIEGKLPKNLIAESEKSIAIVSLEGTPLVLPKKHVDIGNIYESIEDMIDVYRLANKLEPFVKTAYGVGSVNLLENRGKDAGQEISHYHMHIVPRVQGDKLLRVRRGKMGEADKVKLTELIRNLMSSSLVR